MVDCDSMFLSWLSIFSIGFIGDMVECPNKGTLKGQMGNQLGYMFLRILV
jgi:hypothetical protein